MTIDLKTERAERFTKWFASHHAYRYGFHEAGGSMIDMITWRRVETSNYLVRYHSIGSTLLVTGDLETATYHVGGPGGFDFWASCDLDYFAGKCIASPTGQGYWEWDRRVALDALTDREYIREPVRRLLARFHGLDCVASSLEWTLFLGHHGGDVFGGEYYEYANIGRVISDRCAAHLFGLKMAMKQLAR